MFATILLCCAFLILTAVILLRSDSATLEQPRTMLRYRVQAVRFRNNGLPYTNDIRNLAADCGVEVYCGGDNWGAELPKTFLGYAYGIRSVDFGPVGETKAFLAATLATPHGRKVLGKATILK